MQIDCVHWALTNMQRVKAVRPNKSAGIVKLNVGAMAVKHYIIV